MFVCSGTHMTEACFKSPRLNLDPGKEVVAKHRDCYRCLIIGHQSKQCRGRKMHLIFAVVPTLL